MYTFKGGSGFDYESFILAIFALPQMASAATVTWTNGSGDGEWGNNLNWSDGDVPETDDEVVFDGAVSDTVPSINYFDNGGGDEFYGYIGTINSLTFTGAYTAGGGSFPLGDDNGWYINNSIDSSGLTANLAVDSYGYVSVGTFATAATMGDIDLSKLDFTNLGSGFDTAFTIANSSFNEITITAPASGSFHRLTITKNAGGSGSAYMNFFGNFDVESDFSMSSLPQFYKFNSNTINVAGDASFSGLNTALFDGWDGVTLVLDGTGDQQLNQLNDIGNLTIADTGARTISIQNSDQIVVDGTFTADISSGNEVAITGYDMGGADYTGINIITATGSIGTVDYVNFTDMQLEEDGVIKSPALDPANSGSLGTSGNPGWFTSTSLT